MFTLKSFVIATASFATFSNAHTGLSKRTQEPDQPVCVDFTPFTYAGCFRGASRPLLFTSTLSQYDMTIEKCVAYCKGNDYRYAGLEYYGRCTCGASVNGASVPESECNLKCSGNKTETCGGNTAASIYQDPTFTVVDPTVITDYEDIGCHTEGSNGRSLAWPQAQLTAATMTPEKCLFACKAGGYPLAGLEYGRECYCGVVLGNGTTSIPQTECDSPCLGDTTRKCGGRNKLNIYVAQNLGSLEPCKDIPPPSTVTSTTAPPTTSSTSSTETTTSSYSTTTTASTSTSETTSSTSSTVPPSTSSTSSTETTTSSSSTSDTTTSPTSSTQTSSSTTSDATTSSSSSTTESNTSSTSSSTSTSSSSSTSSTISSTATTSVSSTSSTSSSTSSSVSSTASTSTSSSATSTKSSSTSITSSSTSICTSITTSSTSTKPTTTSKPTTTTQPTTTTKPTITQPPTTSKTTASLCTKTTVVNPAPTCEYKCGNWCSKPIPTWTDKPSCLKAQANCAVQIASCFLEAGWPGSLKCFEFTNWCKSISSYCSGSCSGKGCSKSGCTSQYPPPGPPKPPGTTSTSVYTCAVTSKTSVKTTLTTKKVTTTSTTCIPLPTQTNICKQPHNPPKGYSSNSPVGDIQLPCLTCNNAKNEYSSGRTFKLYTSPESSRCPSYPPTGPSGPPQACKDACDFQYKICMATYATGCKNNSGSKYKDSYSAASKKCEDQKADCYKENANVKPPSSRCGSWNSGWY